MASDPVQRQEDVRISQHPGQRKGGKKDLSYETQQCQFNFILLLTFPKRVSRWVQSAVERVWKQEDGKGGSE